MKKLIVTMFVAAALAGCAQTTSDKTAATDLKYGVAPTSLPPVISPQR